MATRNQTLSFQGGHHSRSHHRPNVATFDFPDDASVKARLRRGQQVRNVLTVAMQSIPVGKACDVEKVIIPMTIASSYSLVSSDLYTSLVRRLLSCCPNLELSLFLPSSTEILFK